MFCFCFLVIVLSLLREIIEFTKLPQWHDFLVFFFWVEYTTEYHQQIATLILRMIRIQIQGHYDLCVNFVLIFKATCSCRHNFTGNFTALHAEETNLGIVVQVWMLLFVLLLRCIVCIKIQSQFSLCINCTFASFKQASNF